MDLLLDNHSGIPIYEQVVSQIKAQILDGSLKKDEALPSMRALAKDLRISVITTKRAYEELEKAGFVYTVAGKGSYVAGPTEELLQENKLILIEGHMEEIRKLAAACSLTREEIMEMWDTIWEDR